MPPIGIQLLGTGTAFHTDGRGSAAILVRPGLGPAFLVDAGPTAMAAIQRYGADYRCVDRLFVTHLHGDHTAGWPFLHLNLAFEAARSRPFDVYGPRGVRDSLNRLSELCYGELLGNESQFEIRYHELEVRETRDHEAGEGRFDALPMDHHPTSLGYRFEIDGRSLAVTGDTRWCDNLERLARGCDLLLLECTTVDESGLAHVSLEQLRQGIGRLGASRIVLVHLTDTVATELATDPIPRVVAGHDGMTLEL